MKDKETLSWIKKARNKHGSLYSYEKTEYLKSHLNVTITCPIHGDFTQIANNHLQGSRCPRCFREYWGSVGKRDSKETFIQKAVNVHGTAYNYKEVVYISSRETVRIICPEHGVFFKKPKYHLRGEGCPMCAKELTREQISKKKTKYLDTEKVKKKELPEIKAEEDNSLFNYIKEIMQIEGETGILKNYMPAKNLNFNVYVSDYKIGFILINPLRLVVDWYLPLVVFKSEEVGIKPVILFTTEWEEGNSEKAKSYIKKLLNKDIFTGKAENFHIQSLSSNEAKHFLQKYSIGSSNNYDSVLGLCNASSFPMHLACFNKNNMVRYVENFKIIGGFKKLINAFFEQNPHYLYIYRELNLRLPEPYVDIWKKEAEFLGYTIPEYRYKYEDKLYSKSWGNKTHLSKTFGIDKIVDLEEFHKEKDIKKVYENTCARWKIDKL